MAAVDPERTSPQAAGTLPVARRTGLKSMPRYSSEPAAFTRERPQGANHLLIKHQQQLQAPCIIPWQSADEEAAGNGIGYHEVAADRGYAGGPIEPSGAGDVAIPDGDKVATGTKFLDAVILGIRDVDAPLTIHRHAPGTIKLPVAGALTSPGLKKRAAGVELLDAVITLSAT